jgi:ATP-binding cassette subfamily B protein/subfamily B ATP-binding cassette protein MsbA
MRGHMAITANIDEQPQDRGRTLQRLLRYLSPYRTQLLLILALIVVNAAAQAAGPALIGRAIDVNIAAGDVAGLTHTMLLLLGVYLLALVVGGIQIRMMGVIGQRFLASLREQIFEKIQLLPLSYFDRTRAGDLMSRLVNDIATLNQLISQGLTQLISSTFALVGIVIAMLLLSWPLALASFVTIPLMLLATRVFSRLSRQAFRRTRTAIGDVSSNIQEDISGVRVAQAFNRTDDTIRRFAESNAANRDANVQAVAVTSAFTPAIDILSNLAIAIVAVAGGWMTLRGRIEVGTVVAFFIYVQNFFRPIQMITGIYTQVQGALAGAERIFELVDEPVRQVDAPNAQPLPRIEGRVVFDHVFFSYGSRPGGGPNGARRDGAGSENVLSDIDLTVEPGQTMALVGPTGAGKTTLVSLIPRFYDVTGGRLLIDGHDVRDVTLASLRSQIGLVPQESFLFSGTIADNIRYGRLDATDAEVEAAARAAGAHDFIMAQPEGYQTRLNERGGGLSQGQRQLLSIARAILADPRILILDEATASIDTRTEALIQRALRVLLKGRTSFVIAHRLSTVREADLVVVLDHGQIVERGTHDELLARGGLYAELYRRQFRDTPALAA